MRREHIVTEKESAQVHFEDMKWRREGPYKPLVYVRTLLQRILEVQYYIDISVYSGPLLGGPIRTCLTINLVTNDTCNDMCNVSTYKGCVHLRELHFNDSKHWRQQLFLFNTFYERC